MNRAFRSLFFKRTAKSPSCSSTFFSYTSYKYAAYTNFIIYALCSNAFPSLSNNSRSSIKNTIAYIDEKQQKSNIDLKKYEKLLVNMKTVHADFSQISENGANVAEGEIFIKKPGKARITYSNSPMEIITVGTWLVQYDKKTKGTTYIDLKSVPLYFILQPNAAFREYVNVLGIVQSASNTKIIATLKQNKASDGQITIVFGENPLRLEGWIIHPTGAKPIVVNLRNVKMNCPISDEVFKFDDPRIRDKLGSTD